MTDQITAVQRFWKLLKPDRKEISQVYIYAIFTGLLNLSLPLGISAIINLIMMGQVSTSWVILVIFVMIGIAGTGILQIMQLRISENIEQRIFTRASFEFIYRIPRIRLEELYKHYAPELMNRFFDTLNIQKGLAKLLIELPASLLQILFGLILLSIYNPFFILFSLILLLLVTGIFWFTGKKGLDTSLKESKYKYQVAHWLEEVARANQTFKLAGKTDLHLQKVDTHVTNYLHARESHFKVLVGQYKWMVAFKVFVATGLLVLGGLLVINQQMNIGQFVAAEIIVLLVLSSVEKLILSLKTIYDVLTALEKMGQLTDMELERDSGNEIGPQQNDRGMALELIDVQFNYPDMERPILDQLNLSVKPGERIALTGENGSGKSTLLHILAGLYSIKGGNILYDGDPIGSLDYNGLRAVIGAYLAEDVLFEGTLLENIGIGREKATMENIRWAIKNVGLEPFIKRLPEGIYTTLDPDGKKLPGSIIRKILMARSIADKPRLLLLEDPLEHEESAESKRIIDFLTDPKNPWTLVAISTNPLFQAACTSIIEVEKGKVLPA
ncbi:MAG: ATP-binding cassette domain-containing protein [Saprospiraceae bacterium]|nr:ATP-binding cassette domain-containing protein [Saprospiraceae bacterium]